jgi:hypothetical protein
MSRSKLKSGLTWACSLVVSLGIAVSLVALWGWMAYGSPWAIPALARHEIVLVTPGVISLGQIEVGSKYATAVELTNLSARPVSVIGCRSNCACIGVAETLPLDLPAGGWRL